MVTREEEEARCLGSPERECQVELLEGWESAHGFSHGGLGLPGRGCMALVLREALIRFLRRGRCGGACFQIPEEGGGGSQNMI